MFERTITVVNTWFPRFRAAMPLLLVAAVLVLVGCGGDDSSSAEPTPNEPVEATAEETPDDGGEEPSEPDVPTDPLLDPPFALEIDDVALVLGGDIVCQVAVDGITCAEVGEDGSRAGRYAITVSGTDVRVTLTPASGEAETVFLDAHVEPSSDSPLEPAETQETVILEEGDAVRVSGTDIVCVAGEIGFIGCSRLDDDGGGPRRGTLAVGLDSAGVSVASVELDGTLVEVFSRTYDE